MHSGNCLWLVLWPAVVVWNHVDSPNCHIFLQVSFLLLLLHFHFLARVSHLLQKLPHPRRIRDGLRILRSCCQSFPPHPCRSWDGLRRSRSPCRSSQSPPCRIWDRMPGSRSISSPASTSPSGRTAIEPVTSSVDMRCSGYPLQFPLFLIAPLLSFHFSFFASASVVSAVFSLLCFRSDVFSFFFDLF